MSKQCINYKVELNDYLKVINEPNRLKILCLLKKQKMCVCDIEESLSLPQNLVSHHLGVLRDYGLLASERGGQKIIYFRQEENIVKYQGLLNKIINL
jgi:ArsR family transcriptional regulator, arsenate/arsenite/antimonite-responsive transcriptional repressor